MNDCQRRPKTTNPSRLQTLPPGGRGSHQPRRAGSQRPGPAGHGTPWAAARKAATTKTKPSRD
eukprot:4575690-Pyramimonas_sp.AAC.1